MQGHYLAQFEREMGCTEAELLRWLPGASGARPIDLQPGRASIAIDAGRLLLSWQQLSPRRIALMVMPRLAITFEFDGIDDAARQVFMRHFDLYTQRGGG